MANEKRLIDANALNDSKWWESLTDDFDKARARIIVMSAPTVQAVEVVHARWIDVRQYCGDYMCSNCKELSRTKIYNYCPNCGAKMDGGNEDANKD